MAVVQSVYPLGRDRLAAVVQSVGGHVHRLRRQAGARRHAAARRQSTSAAVLTLPAAATAATAAERRTHLHSSSDPIVDGKLRPPPGLPPVSHFDELDQGRNWGREVFWE